MESVDTMFRRGIPVAVVAVLVGLIGCGTVADQAGWPEVEAAQEAPEAEDGEPRLVRGEDGFVYAVGQFSEPPEPGETVFGRYDGDWPREGMDRPALFAGEVADRHSERVVRVHPLYQFPETELEELGAEVADGLADETMGKAIADVEAVEDRELPHVRLGLGGDRGVQQGDLYAIVEDFDGAEPTGAQLTRRLRGICMVVETDHDNSSCRIHQGHPDHPGWEEARTADRAVFLEPSFGDEPREGTVKIAGIGDEEIDEWMVDQLDSYLQRVPGGNVDVELIDEDADATDKNFHRWTRRLDTEDEPTILVGATLLDDERLVLNYTGIGTAAGPGMVAAPPEGGVEMGPVGDVDNDDWRGFGAVVMGALMVYRGQTAEALGYLHQALRDEGLDGPWRWHTRDQYLMRWGAVDRFEEAMWLVREDEAVAGDDHKARDNAVGTRVRLHDYLEQHDQAAQLAETYLEWREDDRPESGYLSALAMYAEMIIQVDEIEEARRAVDEILELCPDGCQGDVIPLLAGIYWAATDVSPDLQDEIVDAMVRIGEQEPRSSLASARMFQGWTFMRDDDFDQALIAFLEAERLFEEREKSPYGASRAQFYISLTQIARDEPQEAFDYGMQAREYMTEIGDYRSVTRIYERLAEIYVEVDTAGPPEEFMIAGGEVLQSGLQTQLGSGDWGRAAEAGFAYGHYLFRTGSLQEARLTLQTAITRAIRVARFDMAAMSRIFLAIIARAEGDMQLFHDELDRAETMAEVVDDPQIWELIEDLRDPPQDDTDDDPTQLL